MSTPKSLVDKDGATVEAMLTPLISQYGIDRVLSDLDVLFGSASWENFQRVGNIARLIARRMEKNS